MEPGILLFAVYFLFFLLCCCRPGLDFSKVDTGRKNFIEFQIIYPSRAGSVAPAYLLSRHTADGNVLCLEEGFNAFAAEFPAPAALFIAAEGAVAGGGYGIIHPDRAGFKCLRNP